MSLIWSNQSGESFRAAFVELDCAGGATDCARFGVTTPTDKR